VARMEGEVHSGLWWGNLKERGHLKGQGVDGRLILKHIKRKFVRRGWTRLT
jgi:hypothetical protein